MRSIPFNEALELLKEAHHIELLDVPATVSGFHLQTHEDADYFMHLEADDDDGQVWEFDFVEADNLEVKVEGSAMYLVPSEETEDRSPVMIQLLAPMDLESP